MPLTGQETRSEPARMVASESPPSQSPVFEPAFAEGDDDGAGGYEHWERVVSIRGRCANAALRKAIADGAARGLNASEALEEKAQRMKRGGWPRKKAGAR